MRNTCAPHGQFFRVDGELALPGLGAIQQKRPAFTAQRLFLWNNGKFGGLALEGRQSGILGAPSGVKELRQGQASPQASQIKSLAAWRGGTW